LACISLTFLRSFLPPSFTVSFRLITFTAYFRGRRAPKS
jgi:hypothetical protein